MGLAETDYRRHEELCNRLAADLKADIIEKCRKCRGSGWITEFIDDELGPFAPGHSRPCRCRRKVRRLNKLAEAGVPRELWLAHRIEPENNEEFFEELADYASDLDRAFKTGMGFLLHGENGTGKSSSAAIAIIGALRKGHTAAFIDFRDLVEGWFRAFQDPEHQRYLDRRCNRSLVVLDELGKEAVTDSKRDFVLARFDSLLRLRRGAYLPTIIITNLEPTAIERRYGKSVESLLSDRFRHLAYRPGDYRLSAASWETITSSVDAIEHDE